MVFNSLRVSFCSWSLLIEIFSLSDFSSGLEQEGDSCDETVDGVVFVMSGDEVCLIGVVKDGLVAVSKIGVFVERRVALL